MNWRRSQVVLAGMAAGGAKAQFNPVQAQKIFFIFDRVIPDKIDGPHFAFAPCHFGPFDKEVYHELYALRRTGEVAINHARRYPRYALTETGFRLGGRDVKGLSALDGSLFPRRSAVDPSVAFPRIIEGDLRSFS